MCLCKLEFLVLQDNFLIREPPQSVHLHKSSSSLVDDQHLKKHKAKQQELSKISAIVVMNINSDKQSLCSLEHLSKIFQKF